MPRLRRSNGATDPEYMIVGKPLDTPACARGFRKAGRSFSYYDQQNVLPEIKAARAEFVELGSRALQQTLRKLDLAFQAFFRRVKAGQAPGFPRFKASKRFSGFCYPDPAGWKLAQDGTRAATIRIGSGKDAISIRARGQHRFGDGAKANDLTITRKNGERFASVTLRVSENSCARARTGDEHRGVDFGLTDWATFENGETIDNPRFVRNEMPRMATLAAPTTSLLTTSLRGGAHPHTMFVERFGARV